MRERFRCLVIDAGTFDVIDGRLELAREVQVPRD